MAGEPKEHYFSLALGPAELGGGSEAAEEIICARAGGTRQMLMISTTAVTTTTTATSTTIVRPYAHVSRPTGWEPSPAAANHLSGLKAAH